MGQLLHFLNQIPMIVGDPFGLVAWDQAALEPGIMGGDARGAGVLVALQRLNAAQGEHKAPGRHAHVGAEA